MKRKKEGEHYTFEVAPTSPMNASPQVLQPFQEIDAHNTHALRRSSRQMAHSQRTSRNQTAPKPTTTAPTTRKKKESLKEQEATSRARRKQLIDAGVEKLVAEYMEKAEGDHNKAAGFWFEREEQKRRQPWPGLIEGEAFIENMKKDILDPLEIERQMEEEEEAAERRAFSRRLFARARGLVASKTAPAAPSVDSKQQTPAEAQQLATLTTFDLTTRTKPVVNPKPPSAASSKQLAPSITLPSAKMLSTPLTNTLPQPSPSEKQVLPSNKRKRKQTEAKKLLSELGGEWTVNVTDTGHRPCVKKPRHQNELE
ncbi:hypothetical protein F4801DRAFT_527339 [Xylaria longipes]|nr:hypothetical protein F4801DRAFT_527339 [Xylaria longipes]